MGFLKNFFGNRILRSFDAEIFAINSLEQEISAYSDEALKKESDTLRERAKGNEPLDALLPRAFALVREAARRTLHQRPFDVQLMGGITLHRGAIAEMATGEGKTLAAVAPVYLNSLAGKGVHVVTVNEYLARRDTVWMGQIYHMLGMSVACLGGQTQAFLYDPTHTQINQEQRANSGVSGSGSILLDAERDITGSFLVQNEFLRPISRREAYLADITYGTNHEYGFDYLRDNLTYSITQQVQREHYFSVIDEVDSVLIDEARTPLIISAPDAKSSDLYKVFARVVSRLVKDDDYTVDEKLHSVLITESGIEKVEQFIGVKNLYASEHVRLAHYLEESLKAKELYRKDKEYVVKNGEVIIVDEFTGRMLQGRRYSGGLHQAIEAKEGVLVKEESRTYAKISIQNYFRMYEKIAGMTGTAQTSAEEFHKVYGLEVVTIPTNKPIIRNDVSDKIYKNKEGKWRAVAREVKERHENGQPILIGTTSIEKSDTLSSLLAKEGVPHEVLNAKRHEAEGQIIAQAGRYGAVTVATNMAGRGVDIILGGNPPKTGEAEKVCGHGGLHVIGTERHEARRIDNQLRGRAGRQGDPGSSQFFLSLEDDLLRIFGGERLQSLMDKFNVPDDQPIDASVISKLVAQAQGKVEGFNFDIRKHLIDYDDVLNRQRTAFYKKRQAMLGGISHAELANVILEATKKYAQEAEMHMDEHEARGEVGEDGHAESRLKQLFKDVGITTDSAPFPDESTEESIEALLVKRSMEVAVNSHTHARLVGILDMLWMNHLEDLEELQESVRLRAYGQKDPLVEYREESRILFQELWKHFDEWVFTNVYKFIDIEHRTQNTGTRTGHPSDLQKLNISPKDLAKTGRNDPCPCGATHADGRPMKYKHCHGKNV